MKRQSEEHRAMGMSCEQGSCIQSSLKTASPGQHVLHLSLIYFWKRNTFRWFKVRELGWVYSPGKSLSLTCVPSRQVPLPRGNHNSSPQFLVYSSRDLHIQVHMCLSCVCVCSTFYTSASRLNTLDALIFFTLYILELGLMERPCSFFFNIYVVFHYIYLTSWGSIWPLVLVGQHDDRVNNFSLHSK